jgi:hypothetical protein
MYSLPWDGSKVMADFRSLSGMAHHRSAILTKARLPDQDAEQPKNSRSYLDAERKCTFSDSHHNPDLHT